MTQPSLWIFPLLLTFAAAATDLRTREIPDVLPIAIAAWGVFALAMGWTVVTAPSAAIGVSVGLAAGMLLFASGGFGGGDAKLIAALGVVLGGIGLLWLLLYMALAGGALALIAKARKQTTFAYGPAIAAGLLIYDLRLCFEWRS